MHWTIAITATVLFSTALLQRVNAQDQDQDDPPGRVARLGYMQGSVSFEPAGESDWVPAVPNRPMTTGDKIWADKDSRAQIELGSAVIYLNSNTGVSFLNVDDRTAQIELSAGSISVRVRHLNRDDVFEIDTPNQAFSVMAPGHYRVEASEDGNYTVVSVREGTGESTGNGQTYTIRAGQRVTLQGTSSLNAAVENLGGPDDFDSWSDGRDRRYDNSRSAQYCSRDVVGYEDLDDNGDWRPDSTYGDVWYPHVAAGWAPYREGHWAWIDPWGWTWVDEESWGYAPFHYGRWASISGRWGWIPGPREVAPVYAPALVVFVGGGGGFGGNIGWFPLGPREVYVPSYGVSPAYVNRVNVSNTVVNTTTITNVYNTTIVNKSTTINNVNYVNRHVSNAVTAVPQRTFVSAQPVARSAVAVHEREVASAAVMSRAAVAPTSNSVLGAGAGRTAPTPPAKIANRQVIAKATPPPAPIPFAARQQVLAEHPGQPIARQELQRMRPDNSAPTHPQVKQAPPGRPATPTVARSGQPPANRPVVPPAGNESPNAPRNQPNPSNQPAPNHRPEANRPENNHPEANRPEPNQPDNRPAEPPVRNDRPSSAQPNNRPEPNRPESNRPEANRPQPNQPNNRPAEPPARNEHPSTEPPNARPEPNRAEPNRPEPNRPEPNRPVPTNRPEPPARNEHPSSAPPNTQPEANRPEPNRPEPNPPKEAPRRNEPAAPPSKPEPPKSEPPKSEPQRTPPPAESRPEPKQQQHEQPPEKRQEEPKNDDRPDGLM
ncbi:MAG TPA: DUF6600 domain-containing protein [Candidatus Sulfotelmatobacter sp.]|nr:DUF6600 domain-containing protein [Candidatus Sulfotelmatobacter sp.]